MIGEFYIPFVVDDEPYCLWNENLRERNLELLSRIDPEYFEYVANTNFSLIDKKETDKRTRQYAATSLRIAYSQGLETLFALLCATAQTPKCIVGWMLKYGVNDLENVVRKINNNEFFRSRVNTPPVTWKIISETIFSYVKDKEIFSPYIEKFANLWKNFAYEFVKPSFRIEYNNFKHGLRANMGGFRLAIGETVPLTPENSINWTESEFGSTFFVPEKIGKHNFVLYQQSRNWNPENHFHALHLISTSIKNIISFHKNYSGIDFSELEYTKKDLDYFNKPWENRKGASEIRVPLSAGVKTIPLLTKEQILSTYDTE